MIRVVLADDHELVRSGIRALLSHERDVEVVGEAANGVEALERTAALLPDVVILDVTMPELNGIEATKRLKREHPEVGVLLLSMHSSDATIRRARDAGADGYLLKDAGQSELGLAVRAVGSGETYMSPPIKKRLAEGRVGSVDNEPLTSRQVEVLQLVAEGHSTKGIALRLGISPKTVENHRSQVMERLDVRGIPALVKYAISKGLIPAE